MKALCHIEGCRHTAMRKGMCWGHLKRAQRGRPLEGELQQPLTATRDGPKRSLMEAVERYYNALADGEEERAWSILRNATHRYVKTEKLTDRRRGGHLRGCPPPPDTPGC